MARNRARSCPGSTGRAAPAGVALTLALTLALALAAAACLPRDLSSASTPTPSASPTETVAASTSTAPSTQTPYVITVTSQAPAVGPRGLFFLSLAEAGHQHLFAYSPQSLPLTRLTAGAWDDVGPALSPDGKLLAFASDRSGRWNFYVLDLASGALRQLSDSAEYKAAPSWSPDGVWLTYEDYAQDNLEIFIRSVIDPGQAPIQLTIDPALDTSPAWSPLARQITFASSRSGEPEIWIADLDRTGNDQFIDVSRSPETVESHPAWSPDGARLAWASADPASGLTGVYVWDARDPQARARWLGAGDWPFWMDNDRIASRLSTPGQTYLVAYTAGTGALDLPPTLLPGSLQGIAYGILSQPMPGPFQAIAQATPAALYSPQLNPQPDVPAGRATLVTLPGVQAAYPQLHELADDAFQALRGQVASEVGWDALASLENAFVPLTTPLEPGLGTDWLYTGRAFTLNPALIDAGYMVVVREDFGQQTYWRIYIRTTAQDGSQGAPLQQVPWDLAARTGDSASYERGGRLMTSIPSGYWLDLTALAAQYGWERLPALTNWRTYYAGARFNELAFTQGLDWRSAMLQLYPLEVLVTPTVLIPPTRTWTRTPLWYRSPTPTRTPSPGPTDTP